MSCGLEPEQFRLSYMRQLLSDGDALFTDNGISDCGDIVASKPDDELEAFGTTTSVDTYPGRIFKQGKVVHMSNHILSIVGWGYDADLDKEYWVLRNSW